ncbi:MAG: hypothetical protein ING66_01395 [Rhodocyclaceae bacterium]|nr:hypothetical protein [Rhodocyclaceae bacterium]MCA3082340.1 hypothetical protein [Rhodocyclaceae bacterium]MCA3086137.1 hypothetical protein [Rhodocyclaceae bacterium]
MTQRNAPANYPKRISNRMAMVEDPAHYRRTSYHANALGQADARFTPHPLYLLPGRADNVQQAAYRSLFRAGNLYVRDRTETRVPVGAEQTVSFLDSWRCSRCSCVVDRIAV